MWYKIQIILDSQFQFNKEAIYDMETTPNILSTNGYPKRQRKFLTSKNRYNTLEYILFFPSGYL
jgi:hypothetical protein